MSKKLIGFCLFLLIGSSSFAAVDIAEIGVGARPLGLGKATVGGLDDASAIFTNPAGLTLNPNLNIISMSGSILSDINYVVVGASDTAPLGRVGIGYINASVGSIPITTVTGTGSTAAVSWEGSANYGSSIIFFTYGTKLSRWLWGNYDNVSVGASLKYFMQGFSGGGSSLQNATGTGMDADIGLTAQVHEWARLGLSFNNCLPVSAGGKFTWQRNGIEESIPMATRAGGTFILLGENGLKKNKQDLNLMLEYETGRGANRPSVWHTGLEYWPVEMLAIRAGIDQKPTATETGTSTDNNLTAGLGLKYLGFTFDYAYHQFGDLTENTTHFFSIGYRGPETMIKKAVKQAARKGSSLPLAEVAPKPVVKAFSDVPKGYWARTPIEYLSTLGIMSGYPDKTFRPERTLTRGELAALLVKAKGFSLKGARKEVFKDVPAASWVAPYVKVAVDREYVKGYPDGTFKPNQKINRAEAAVVFAKFSGLYVKNGLKKKVFPDVPETHWAAPAIAADQQEGLYEYLAGKDFVPKQDLTRAEAAEMLSKTPLIKEKIKDFIAGEK